MHQFENGDRVCTRKWAPEIHTGTVTSVHEDGETIYVRWDGASFTEDEMDVSEVEKIEGHDDDATAPYVVMYPTGRTPAE
jgi:hypothetical protein